MAKTYIYPELSKIIIDAYFEVCRHLSVGYEEKVYERALAYELALRGLDVETQKLLTVTYKGVEVGMYKPDIVVNNCIILELKAVKTITEEHKAQLINYLTVTQYWLGYVLNFGQDRRFMRFVGPAAMLQSE